MVPMIQRQLRARLAALITPPARFLLSIGLTANAVTAIGGLGAVASALFFFTRGEFLMGTILVAFFVLSDLLDGTMARLSHNGGTPLGALFDSTLDRFTDACILLGIYLFYQNSEPLLANLLLSNLLLGVLISYIRARAESLELECSVGIAERSERLIIILIGTGFLGLGFTDGFLFTQILLLILSTITVTQRMKTIALQSRRKIDD
jgi:CDP-diacylglycerol--glycerol-3-phosphate 3-phosphatidyltransferase